MIETWGSGTLKMATLMDEAGLTPPEFEERINSVVVRFLPTHYIPPTRVGHDLSLLQREILQVLADRGPCSSGHVHEALKIQAATRTVQENLQLLRDWGLVDSQGKGRAFTWMLKGVRR
jgi:ATP-dependent DNA helicase RecG